MPRHEAGARITLAAVLDWMVGVGDSQRWGAGTFGASARHMSLIGW